MEGKKKEKGKGKEYGRKTIKLYVFLNEIKVDNSPCQKDGECTCIINIGQFYEFVIRELSVYVDYIPNNPYLYFICSLSFFFLLARF